MLAGGETIAVAGAAGSLVWFIILWYGFLVSTGAAGAGADGGGRAGAEGEACTGADGGLTGAEDSLGVGIVGADLSDACRLVSLERIGLLIGVAS